MSARVVRSTTTKAKAKAKPAPSDKVLTLTHTEFSALSEAAKAKATEDATRLGKSVALALTAKVEDKANAEQWHGIATEFIATFGTEDTHTMNAAKAKAWAAGVRVVIRGMYAANLIPQGKGARPKAGQVSSATVAQWFGVSAGRVRQYAMAERGTHTEDGRPTEATKATEAKAKAKGLTAATLAAKVEALDDAIDKGVTYSSEDVDTLRRAAAALRIMADRVEAFAKVATEHPKAKASTKAA